MEPTQLLYSDHESYRKTMLPFAVHEFWYQLRNDFIEERKQEKLKKITASIIQRSYSSIVLDNPTKKFISLQLITTVRYTKYLKDLYPSRGDLVMVTNRKKPAPEFGFVDDVSRTGGKTEGLMTLNYRLITRFTSLHGLPDQLSLTTAGWILSYLTTLESLDSIPQSILCDSILEPHPEAYKLFSATEILSPITKESLNEKQTEIMSRVIATIQEPTAGICLIQGPPGTGKSICIKNIIANALKTNSASRLLVCAPSNKAIDELVIKLLDIQPAMQEQSVPFFIVRVGREEKMHKKVLPVSLQMIGRDWKKHPVHNKLNMNTYQIEEEILKKANIIACTLSSCYTNYKMKSVFGNGALQIPFCIIDEAAQATELLTLVPTLLRIKRLILVGDPQQLPPTILSNKAKEYGYDSSLFARAQLIFQHELENPIVMLDTQYRMLDTIAQWPNRYFYGGLLKNAALVAPLDFCNYKVFNHSFSQKDDGRSNLNEAILVANLIHALREKSNLINSEKKITIGVITPYQNQRKLINSIIKKLDQKKEQPIEMKIKKRSDKDEDDVDGISDVEGNSDKNYKTENSEKKNIDAKNNEEIDEEDCKENSSSKDSSDSSDEDENINVDIHNCGSTIISEAAKLEMKKKIEKQKKDRRAQKKKK
ncbi:putative helicase senataxin isoform X2 [Cotesia typhae]